MVPGQKCISKVQCSYLKFIVTQVFNRCLCMRKKFFFITLARNASEFSCASNTVRQSNLHTSKFIVKILPGIPSLPGLPGTPRGPMSPASPGGPGVPSMLSPGMPRGPSGPGAPLDPGDPSRPGLPSSPGTPYNRANH